jgi:hypothetical protein
LRGNWNLGKFVVEGILVKSDYMFFLNFHDETLWFRFVNTTKHSIKQKGSPL